MSALIALAVGNQKFRMLWRRETGPKRHGRACPGYPRVSAQRTTARGGEVKKALFLRPLRPRAARCLNSSLRRRGGVEGGDKPGQDGRGSETSRKQPANSYALRANLSALIAFCCWSQSLV